MVGRKVTFQHYGETKTGIVARVAHNIVWLTSGRWLHLESVTLVD